MKTKSTIIPLKDAVDWTTNYRKTMRKGDAKAFLIHTSTMIDVLKDMNIIRDNGDGHFSIKNTDNTFLRAYMAVDKAQTEANGQKLVFVGTKEDAKGVYRDLIASSKNKSLDNNQEDGDGNIYDFTRPCPNKCDPDSDLNG